MVHLLALLIFAALSAACWVGAAALYAYTFRAPAPACTPVAAAAAGLAALASFVPFPAGYAVGLACWAAAASAGTGLPAGRAAVLWLYLAAGSFATRPAALGVLAAAAG